jgi:hypothetical protein
MNNKHLVTTDKLLDFLYNERNSIEIASEYRVNDDLMKIYDYINDTVADILLERFTIRYQAIKSKIEQNVSSYNLKDDLEQSDDLS